MRERAAGAALALSAPFAEVFFVDEALPAAALPAEELLALGALLEPTFVVALAGTLSDEALSEDAVLLGGDFELALAARGATALR